MCQCAVALSQRAVVFVARKVDMCGMGCSDALPTHFITRPNSGHVVCLAGSLVCILYSGALFLRCLISGLSLSLYSKKHGRIFHFHHSVICMFSHSRMYNQEMHSNENLLWMLLSCHVLKNEEFGPICYLQFPTNKLSMQMCCLLSQIDWFAIVLWFKLSIWMLLLDMIICYIFWL